MWNLKEMIQMYLLTKHRLTDLQNKCMTAVGGGIVREFGMDKYTLLHLKQKTNKDVPYSIWKAAQCYVAAWMGGEFGGEQIHVYVWLRLFPVHLKLSQHCSSALPQNKIKRCVFF